MSSPLFPLGRLGGARVLLEFLDDAAGKVDLRVGRLQSIAASGGEVNRQADETAKGEVAEEPPRRLRFEFDGSCREPVLLDSQLVISIATKFQLAWSGDLVAVGLHGGTRRVGDDGHALGAPLD